MDLSSINQIESATKWGRNEMFHIGTGLLFVVVIMLYTSTIDVVGRPFSIELIIAAIFEASGALIAGGDVVSTIKKGIIDPALIPTGEVFIWLMMAALLAGAVWLNMATAVGAPVSTTHSIVGGVLGAGIAAGGWGIANWPTMGKVAASWVISPVLGGLIAAAFLFWIKHSITYKKDMVTAAKRMVPASALMAAMLFFTIKGMMLP